jgi:hypothetical protein
MYKVKYYVTDLEGNEVESATTYTNENFESYVAAAEWLESESDWFVEACTIDTNNNPECVEVADELAVVRIASRGDNDPIREIPLLAGIEIETAIQQVTEYRNDFHFRFEGHDYQWTQFVGERGVVEYWKKDGKHLEGGDEGVIYDIFGEDISEVFNNNLGIHCNHTFRQECRRCGKEG